MSSDQKPKIPERRSDPRNLSRIDAIVEDEKLGSLTFTASGFTRKGAFLRRRDRSTPLPAIGSVIKLVLNWPIETHIPPIRLQATVIHQNDDGVGVQFEMTK